DRRASSCSTAASDRPQSPNCFTRDARSAHGRHVDAERQSTARPRENAYARRWYVRIRRRDGLGLRVRVYAGAPGAVTQRDRGHPSDRPQAPWRIVAVAALQSVERQLGTLVAPAPDTPARLLRLAA